MGNTTRTNSGRSSSSREERETKRRGKRRGGKVSRRWKEKEIMNGIENGVTQENPIPRKRD